MGCGCHIWGSRNADNGGHLVGTSVGVLASKSLCFFLPPPSQDCGARGDLLDMGEGGGKSLHCSMYSRVLAALVGRAVS